VDSDILYKRSRPPLKVGRRKATLVPFRYCRHTGGRTLSLTFLVQAQMLPNLGLVLVHSRLGNVRPSQHQYQELLPNDTVRLVQARDFMPINSGGSAPATVPPANVQKLLASSTKDLHNPGFLSAAALRFLQNHRRTHLRHLMSQQRSRLILAPAPPRNEPLPTALAHVSSRLCRQQAIATNAAALLLALSAVMSSTKAALLSAPLLIKEARGCLDTDE
jgi:hypothetical protein